MAELKPLRVTTRERLVQQTSAIQAGLSALHKALERYHPEVLDTHPSRLFPEHTIGSNIADLISRLQQMADDTNDTYWDTIEYPGGENGFPYKGSNL